jgi:hypothetical protein
MTQKMLELNRAEAREATEARAAEAREAEAREAEFHAAAPALFAEPGDIFEVQDRYDERSTFEYEGRTMDDDWLMFQISDGDRIIGVVRDALGVYPIATYAIVSDDGTSDPTRIKLPPSMCYMFRLPECFCDDDYEPEANESS